MQVKPAKIVVIHDGLIPDVDPILIELKEEFNEEVIHFINSNEGLEYVLNNLNQRMVVLLDKGFSKGEKSGLQVFEEIRAETSLVYIILITADPLSSFSNDELIQLVNHDAFAVENVTNDYTKIIYLIRSAVHKLGVQVSTVIEQWISEQPEERMNEPYILDSDGTSYTLIQVSDEIRRRSEFGMRMEKNILLLTIDLFANGARYVND